MIPSDVRTVADAILYEGYLLYPYRPTSLKNTQRWTFGGLCPRDCQTAAGGGQWFQQTECLVLGDEATRLEVIVRFLQMVADESTPAASSGRVAATCCQAVERTVQLADARLTKLTASPRRQSFGFPPRGPQATDEEMPMATSVSPPPDVGLAYIEGVVELTAYPESHGAFRLRVRVKNLTPVPPLVASPSLGVFPQTMAATHAILCVRGGAFVSLLDPEEPHGPAARRCRNIGAWPVLAGRPGGRDVLLSAPIILYDYPQVAAASPGDFFDCSEIDELLTGEHSDRMHLHRVQAHAHFFVPRIV